MQERVIWTLLLVTIGVTVTLAVDGYQAKCTIAEGGGYKIDSCDATKFLSCQASRCMCNDIGNQLYDYRLEPVASRSKRGLKKKIAIGVGAGAVGYIAGNAAAKGSSGSGSGSSKHDKHKGYVKQYSCYGRVGSPCVLEYNNINVVPLTTPSTTTPTPTTLSSASTEGTPIVNGNGTELANVTTTSTTTTTAAPSVIYDITKIPKCVRNAVCTRPHKPSSGLTSGGVVKIEGDPRIGMCGCADGYKSTDTDRCEKSGSQVISSLPVFLSIAYAVIISQII